LPRAGTLSLVRTNPRRAVDRQEIPDLRRHLLRGDRIRPHTARAAIRVANGAIGEVRVMLSLFVMACVVIAVLVVGR
jgi:hypothetical protein